MIPFLKPMPMMIPIKILTKPITVNKILISTMLILPNIKTV